MDYLYAPYISVDYLYTPAVVNCEVGSTCTVSSLSRRCKRNSTRRGTKRIAFHARQVANRRHQCRGRPQAIHQGVDENPQPGTRARENMQELDDDDDDRTYVKGGAIPKPGCPPRLHTRAPGQGQGQVEDWRKTGSTRQYPLPVRVLQNFERTGKHKAERVVEHGVERGAERVVEHGVERGAERGGVGTSASSSAGQVNHES